MPDYERIRQILRFPAAQSINFACQGVPVNPALFNSVAAAVGNTDSNRPMVGIRIDSALPRGVEAMYHPPGNVFVIRNDAMSQIYDEVTIVHEAVHCGFDLQRRANWRWFGQEACGYIAGARYAINKGVAMETIVVWNSEYAIAWNIARRLSPGTVVTWEQYLPLRMQLLAAARTPGSAYYGLEDAYNYVNDGPSSR